MEEIISHFKQGYPASLATGKRETPAMKKLGLHECHCYPVLDWIGSDGKTPGESDYLTIRNPHNRIRCARAASSYALASHFWTLYLLPDLSPGAER